MDGKVYRKKMTRTTGRAERKKEFLLKMDDLFDMAHSDALGKMKIEEDKFAKKDDTAPRLVQIKN